MEKQNQVSVYIYEAHDANHIREAKQGNLDYITTYIIYFVKLDNENKGHYVCIKIDFLNIHTHIVDKSENDSAHVARVNILNEDLIIHISQCYKFAIR